MSDDDKESKKESEDGSFEKPAAIEQALAGEAQAKSESKSEPAQSKAESETKSEAKSEAKSDAKSDAKPEAKSEAVVKPEAVAKPESSANSGAARANFSICELGVSVLLLAILSFLFVNVSVLFLAKRYNDDICRTSIGYAGDAATRGLDTREVCIAAFKGMDKCGIGGFFIEHPRICFFKDDITPTVRTLTISTSTKALLPSPFLIADRSVLDADGQHRTFTTTYVFKLNNPKNCGESFNVISPDGKLHGPASRVKKKTEEKPSGKAAQKATEKATEKATSQSAEKSAEQPAVKKDAATGGAK